jgi:hypothetical protein
MPFVRKIEVKMVAVELRELASVTKGQRSIDTYRVCLSEDGDEYLLRLNIEDNCCIAKGTIDTNLDGLFPQELVPLLGETAFRRMNRPVVSINELEEYVQMGLHRYKARHRRDADYGMDIDEPIDLTTSERIDEEVRRRARSLRPLLARSEPLSIDSDTDQDLEGFVVDDDEEIPEESWSEDLEDLEEEDPDLEEDLEEEAPPQPPPKRIATRNVKRNVKRKASQVESIFPEPPRKRARVAHESDDE